MKFKKFFIIGIFLMLMLLCIACASAGDVNDTTLKTGTDTIKSTDLNGAATDNSKALLMLIMKLLVLVVKMILKVRIILLPLHRAMIN